jgi:hypothetical protein
MLFFSPRIITVADLQILARGENLHAMIVLAYIWGYVAKLLRFGDQDSFLQLVSVSGWADLVSLAASGPLDFFLDFTDIGLGWRFSLSLGISRRPSESWMRCLLVA